MITYEEAVRMDCKSASRARGLKADQLEREIQNSSATQAEKANMLHTLSKYGIFSQDERDGLTRLATNKKHSYYREWLAKAGA